MRKRNRKNPKQKRDKPLRVSCENNYISQEQMTEIYAEAYYKAIKRIEQEKLECKKEEVADQKKSRGYMLGFYLNALLFPFKISNKFFLKSRIYEDLIVMIISVALKGIGYVLWFVGIIIIACGLFQVPSKGSLISMTIYIIGMLFVGGVLIMYGSIFAIVGRDFEKEKDSNRIFAFSAFVLAFASFIVGIIAILK